VTTSPCPLLVKEGDATAKFTVIQSNANPLLDKEGAGGGRHVSRVTRHDSYNLNVYVYFTSTVRPADLGSAGTSRIRLVFRPSSKTT
jgi:hypothetical protein